MWSQIPRRDADDLKRQGVELEREPPDSRTVTLRGSPSVPPPASDSPSPIRAPDAWVTPQSQISHRCDSDRDPVSARVGHRETAMPQHHPSSDLATVKSVLREGRKGWESRRPTPHAWPPGKESRSEARLTRWRRRCRVRMLDKASSQSPRHSRLESASPAHQGRADSRATTERRITTAATTILEESLCKLRFEKQCSRARTS